MSHKKYGFCFSLFDTPCEAAHYAADVMTSAEIETGGISVFETDTTMLLKDYLALPVGEIRPVALSGSKCPQSAIRNQLGEQHEQSTTI